MPTSVSGFDDITTLPTVNVVDQSGVTHTVSYQGHHVIPTTVFGNSSFLQALQGGGLWSQSSFRVNGVSLVWQIDSVTASSSPFRSIVGSAAHTGA